MDGKVEEANLLELVHCLHTFLRKDSAMCVIYYLISDGQMSYPCGDVFNGRIRNVGLPWYLTQPWSDVLERPISIFPILFPWRELYTSPAWNLAEELAVVPEWIECPVFYSSRGRSGMYIMLVEGIT